MNQSTLSTQNMLEKTIMGLLIVFMLLIPYTLHQSSYILAAAGILALGLRIFFNGFSEFKSKEWQRYAWLFAPMAVVYILDLIGMLYTTVPKAGSVILERNLSFVVFPLIFLLLGPHFFTPKRLKIFGLTFCLSNLLIILLYLIGIGVALSTHPTLNSWIEQGQWTVALNGLVRYPHAYVAYPKFCALHHTFQAWYMLTGLSIIIYTYVTYPAWYKPLPRKIGGILLILLYIGIGIILAMSKMGWLVFAFWCLLILIFLLRKRQYKIVLGGSILTLAVVVVLCLSVSSIGMLAGRTYRVFSGQVLKSDGQSTTEQDGSVYPRVLLWKAAVQGIKEKPVFGWGTGGEKVVLHPDQYGLGDLIQDPHNQWLLFGIRFGAIGILAFVWLWFVGFQQAYRTKNDLLFLFLMVSLCFTLTDRTLDIQQGITFFCMAYGLLVKCVSLQKP